MNGRIWRGTGKVPPRGCGFTRNAADAGMRLIPRLANEDFRGTLGHVVEVLPQGAETHSLIRYPSPYGRFCASLCRPPSFPARKPARVRRRSVANSAHPDRQPFDFASEMTLSFATYKQQTRGSHRCEPVIGPFLAFARCSGLEPAAKTSPSRPCSAPERARARRLCSAVRSPRARLSERPETSPIARPIRSAATKEIRPARGVRQVRQTTVAPCGAGGLFHVKTDRSGAGPAYEEGDRKCSRRS